MEPGFLEREIDGILDDVHAALAGLESDDAREARVNLRAAARRLDELSTNLRYEALTAPRLGAPTEPGNIQVGLGMEMDASEH